MKNIISLSVFIIVLLLGCDNQSIQPLEFQNHNLIRRTYYANTNTYTEYFYNAFLKLTMIQSFNKGNLERKSEYEYDLNQKVIKEINYNTYTGVAAYYKVSFEYNQQGLLSNSISSKRMSNGNYIYVSTGKYKYDQNNRLVKWEVYDTSNVQVNYLELYYNSSGNVIETNYYQYGKLLFNDKYEYDEMNNPLLKITADLSASTISNNNVIKHLQNNILRGDDYTASEYTYEYNVKGFPISCSFGGSGKYYYEYN